MAVLSLVGPGGVIEEKKKKKPIPTLPKTVQPLANKAPVVQNQVKETIEEPIKSIVEEKVQDTIQPPKVEEVVTQTSPATEEKLSASEVVKPQAPTRTSQDVATELANASRERQLANLRSAFDKQMATQQRELAQVPQLFREQRGNVQTQATMAQTGLEKQAATQGLSGSGALTQGTIAQNIATQGQLGRLGQQEAQTKADIQARMTQLQNDFASGVADVNSQAEMQRLQDEFNRLTIKEEEAKAQEELAFNRELANIGQYSNDFQAEINRREAINPNDPLIPYLRSARQDKIAGIETSQAEQDEKLRLEQREVEMLELKNRLERENSILDGQIQLARDNNNFVLESQLLDKKAQNDQALQSMRTEGALQEVALKAQFDLNEIVLRDELSKVTESTEGGLPLDTIEQSIANEVGRIPNAEVAKLQEDYLTAASSTQANNIAERIKFLSSQDPNEQVRKLSVMNTIFKNDSWFEGAGGDQKLKSVLATNGITPEEMAEFIQSQGQDQFGGF